jgi:hypothetical protein
MSGSIPPGRCMITPMRRLLMTLALLIADVAAADESHTSAEILLWRGLRNAAAGNCDDAVKDLREYQLKVRMPTPEAIRALKKCDPLFRGDATVSPLQELLVGHWEVSGRRTDPQDKRLTMAFQKSMSCSKVSGKIVCEDSFSLDAFQALTTLTIAWDGVAAAYALSVSDDPGIVYRGALNGTKLSAEYRSPSGAVQRRLSWEFSDGGEATITMSLSRDRGPFRVVEEATLRRALRPDDVEDRRWRQIGWEKCNAKDRAGAIDALSHLDAAGRAYVTWVCSRHGVSLPKDVP